MLISTHGSTSAIWRLGHRICSRIRRERDDLASPTAELGCCSAARGTPWRALHVRSSFHAASQPLNQWPTPTRKARTCTNFFPDAGQPQISYNQRNIKYILEPISCNEAMVPDGRRGKAFRAKRSQFPQPHQANGSRGVSRESATRAKPDPL